LASLSAESGRNVATLTALQENHDDDEEANQNMDGRDQINHK
jgi:hypothetical protein